MQEPAHIPQILEDLPVLAVSSGTTDEEAIASIRPMGSLNGALLGVVRFSGLTPWERHPGGDELLHVLEGEIEVTVLTDSGPERTLLSTGSVFVVPRGLWHRQHPRTRGTVFFATPVEGGETSWAADPRQA